LKTYIKNILIVFNPARYLELTTYTPTNLNEIYNYLNKKIVKSDGYKYKLNTRNNFDLLISHIDWDLYEFNSRSLSKYEIEYVEKLMKSRICISKCYTHYKSNYIEYIELEIKDFKVVSDNIFINNLNTFQVLLKRKSRGTAIILKIFDSSEFPYSLLLNIMSICFLILLLPLFIFGYSLLTFISDFIKPGTIHLYLPSIEYNYFVLYLIISLIYFKLSQLRFKMMKNRLRLFDINFFEKTKLYDFIKQT